jgi:ABC-2 type transport system ATP-binding protein
VLRGLVDDGTTLLLTTQYLEEADHLADDIVVVDRGRVIAQGTPLQLKDASGRASLVVTVSRPEDLDRAEGLMRGVVSEVHVDPGARRLTSPAQGLADVTVIAEVFGTSGIDLDDLGLQRPSLDDVFLHLTGHRAEDTTTGASAGDDPAAEEVRA